MNNERYISKTEQVTAQCRDIYAEYGYRQYKMGRFEEYDLYAANRDFLVSDSIITFTERNGRLMALKPDVTLSIVKNAARGSAGTDKVYYLENVYRTTKSTSEFKEIMQLGLECIGDIGLYQTGEVIALAARSLSVISKNYILDISHMGFISGLIDNAKIPQERRGELMKCINGRNAAGIAAICGACGVSTPAQQRLCGLTGIYGSYDEAMPRLAALSCDEKTQQALDEIRGIYKIMEEMGCGANVNLDFSHTGDMKYYTGVTFCGYIEGIPFAVLSGGRYDSLLHKFGSTGGAVGFAIYLDQLDTLPEERREYDVDVLLVYGNCGADVTARAVSRLILCGKSVRAEKTIVNGVRYRELVRLEDDRRGAENE